MNTQIKDLDLAIISCATKLFVPIARVAFFIIFFYFGILKVLGLSPATPLAEALTAQTIGMQYFAMHIQMNIGICQKNINNFTSKLIHVFKIDLN